MKASSRMIKRMAKGNSSGMMEELIMVDGRKVSSMDLVSTEVRVVRSLEENGIKMYVSENLTSVN